MNRRSLLRSTSAALVAAALIAHTAPAQASGARDVPTVAGPISGNTASDHPFNAAAYQIDPIDLAKVGYREDEYFLSGTANVYQYDSVSDPYDTSVTVLRSGPYTNRILVRRPSDPAHFSGNVIVEILNATNNYDLPIFWSILCAMTRCLGRTRTRTRRTPPVQSSPASSEAPRTRRKTGCCGTCSARPRPWCVAAASATPCTAMRCRRSTPPATHKVRSTLSPISTRLRRASKASRSLTAISWVPGLASRLP